MTAVSVEGGRQLPRAAGAGHAGLRSVLGQVRRRPVYAVAAFALILLVTVAATGPYLPIPDPQDQSLGSRLEAPLSRGDDGTLHVAGTDQLGRDVLARTVSGARISMGVALLTALLAGAIGSTVGLVAGYRGGTADFVISRVIDFQMAFPSLLLAVFLLYLLGPSVNNLVLLLVVFSWVSFARIARAHTFTVRHRPFVEGAVAVGAGELRILFRHIFPHLVPVLAVIAVFDFAGVMLAEASLSFLGLGVQPPGTSWGLMLAQGQQFVYTGGWWLFLVPGLALFITALSANLTSRWLQELTRIKE